MFGTAALCDSAFSAVHNINSQYQCSLTGESFSHFHLLLPRYDGMTVCQKICLQGKPTLIVIIETEFVAEQL
jgi:hypothetical protein